MGLNAPTTATLPAGHDSAEQRLLRIEIEGGLLHATHEGRAFWEDLCVRYRSRGESGLHELADWGRLFQRALRYTRSAGTAASRQTFFDTLFAASYTDPQRRTGR